jgi:hypothetical protein
MDSKDETTNLVDEQPYPKTVDEAVDWLLILLDEAQKEKIRNLPKLFDMIHYHHGLGTWIRNNFGLWYGNDELLQSCGYRRNKHNAYADYASFEILIALWKRFHIQD